MSKALALLAVWWLATALPLPAPAGQQPAASGQGSTRPNPASSSLADVQFMAGHWRNDEKGDVSEEVWTAPAGDSMQGMWRYVSGGRVRLFEALTLTEEDGGVVMRLRHFDPKMGAREEKPFALRLVSRGVGRAVFEGTGTQGLLRITYVSDGADGLKSIVERGDTREEFRFTRTR